MYKRILTAILIGINMLLPLAVPANAWAISGSDFQAGRIIDDSVFFNPATIDVNTIQAFLNSKVPLCDTNGTQIRGATTRAAYGTASGYPPPYTCLKDYAQSTPTLPAVRGLCNQYNGGTKSSAQIIYDVAQACGVNPEVLLVLLEKEQSLITDDWPWSTEYQSATGYGCPDTAACDSTYYGFFNQVFNAAQQFKRYARDSSSFSYVSGRNNFIQYKPNTNCGGSSVFIQNQATAGLYNYTPYQPNAAALGNLNGQGDSCSAYGNRNFWKLFNDWFGPTTTNSDAHTLNFIRLNHYSGKVELIGYPSIGAYGYTSRNTLLPFGDDTSAVPLFRPNGDLSFIKLNDPSGKVVVTTFSASSGFQQLSSMISVPYPAAPPDGSVVPRFRPNGDLSFINISQPSGKVQVVTYDYHSYFQQLSSQISVPYPSVPADGAVVPQFRPNGDLSFIRLNHYSGHVEVVTYSFYGYFQQLSSQIISAYPAVPPDGAVVPQFRPNGDLSFIRLNHYSGHVEVVDYAMNGYFQRVTDQDYSAYPSLTDSSNVKALFSQ
jgi:hypothetical protein